ncbi:MAG TPA: hypothetical protein VM327_01860 [Candidatus Thermoplasmatota archaeon]|nr:hypothetical protein [Candidatus Thermoplasmatota archaeon]
MVGPKLALPLALLLAFVPPALANHPQIAHGDVVVFDHKSGNEWWVEVVLSGGASGSVSGVQAMDTGGPWTTLPKQDWGAYAASFHIEPGHQVRFRALWSGGDTADSCWFTHPAGLEQCGTSSSSSSSSTSTSGGAFDATFSGVKGNNWWVETRVIANQPLAGVDARVNCAGAWRPLALKDWGAWAASFNVPSGAKVDFRARGTSGATDLSGGYTWTAATPTTPCGGSSTTTSTPPPPPAFTASFTNIKGNEWWVETTVAGNQPLAGVDARLGCSQGAGSWNPLTLRSWGAWAGSLHILPGTHVDFRARSTSGATDLSNNAYIWPQATPTDSCDHPWPRVSSFADIQFRDETRSYDGGEQYYRAQGLVHVVWTGSAWDGTCAQRVTRMDTAGVWSNVTETYAWDRAPPKGQLPVTVGGVADLQTVSGGCNLSAWLDQPVVGRETRTFSLRTSSGDLMPIDAYHGYDSDIGYFQDAWWDARLGLMLNWDSHSSSAYHSSNGEGWLLDTDARLTSP